MIGWVASFVNPKDVNKMRTLDSKWVQMQIQIRDRFGVLKFYFESFPGKVTLYLVGIRGVPCAGIQWDATSK